jgi:hypothetical protein
MSCETLSEVFAGDVAEQDERERFLANMAEGLHTLAQPLTILRASVNASAMPNLNPAKQQHYLEISLQQIERACVVFDSLQELVIASQAQGHRAAIDLPALVARAVDLRRTTFQASGVEIRMIEQDWLPYAFGDEARTLQALGCGLEIAASLCAPGDIVELLVDCHDGHIESTIRNDRNHGRLISSAQRLSLLLAETNILNQQGKWSFIADPFSICLALPLNTS